MTDLTPEKLAALAQTGALNREIVAALGREMTVEERGIVDRARVVLRLQRQAKKAKGPTTSLERANKANKRDRLISFRDPAPEEFKRRAKLEADPPAWLRYYLNERFPLPFGPVHLQIIESCCRAMVDGTSSTVAAPRGFGKTAIEWGVALYGALTGKARFPVVIGWKQSAGAELLSQWLDALSDNDRLAEAYPCVCDAFRDSTASKRLQGLLRSLDPEQRAGCDVRKSRGTVLLPETREPTTGRYIPQAALAGASMNGSIKGLNVGLLDGESLRPDIIMLDDPQDEATAASDKLVAKVVRKIDYGLRSLSGPQRRLTVMAAVTCVEPGDVADHLLTRPGTEAIRCGQVLTWPENWGEKESRSRADWDDWNRVRLEGLDKKDGGRAARGHYRRHKKTLTRGMTVSWNHRYHVGDAERPGDPDAIFAAMWDYYDLGEFAFMAERQNQPLKQGVTLYALTPKTIMDRADKARKPGVIPEWGHFLFAATDINRSYALSTAVGVFNKEQRAGVVWYNIDAMHVDESWSDTQKKAAIMATLAEHGKNKLALLPRLPDLWIIDGGGSPQNTVIDFAAQSPRICGIPAICAFGRPSTRYAPRSAGNKIYTYEQACIVRKSMHEQWCLFNADHWREQSQRGWLAPFGAPGSCDLPNGNHRDFAEQCSREILQGKADVGGKVVYVWATQPGPHDFGDCMSMLYAAAALRGVGTGGEAKPAQAARPQKRRIRHVEV